MTANNYVEYYPLEWRGSLWRRSNVADSNNARKRYTGVISVSLTVY